ncbi:kinetochore protein NDC80 homolog [Condylostylus longicornis]|uniref:kinetochore protein NDC80 homolog n=1 Tax=Condylostylus longicornis TaxID=2530218 RepID=UPI00244E33BC|nr:kinetochore protein NDC80 homolog [Condylostylus longicornis]XP_055386509.1 kinetochore protein NDC80 homolog [Condylostylus longicornis]
MAQKPRRISELVQQVGSASTSKPTRISRLPTRSEHTRNSGSRNSSESSAQMKNLLSIATTRPQRSISATPQRTPLRLKTPTRQNKISLTSERSTDKNWIISESIRINEYLKEIEPKILEKSFFEKGGIKNMSTKQFIVIVNHFLKVIGGNRLCVGGDYVESMSKIFNEIGYPHTIAKSWLKTPSAPHTFPNIILLFTWLLTFMPQGKTNDQIEEFENIYAPGNKDFPDKSFALSFIRQAFSAWNNGSDNVLEEAKIKLTNEMIQKACGLSSLIHLDDEIKSLKNEYDEIQLNFEEFNHLDTDFKQKSKKFETLVKSCRSDADEIKHLESQIEMQEKSIKSHEEEFKDIELRVKSQKLSVKQRDSLLVQMNMLNNELKVKKDNISQLQEEGSENQIASARLIHRKTILISKLNTYIHKLFTEIKLSNLSQFEEFSLAKDCELENLKNIEVILKKISQKLISDVTGIENKIQKLEQHIDLLHMEYDNILKPKLETYSSQIEDLNKQLNQAVKTSSIKLDEIEENVRNQELRLEKIRLSNNAISSELQMGTQNLKKLQKCNLQNWTNFEQEVELILTQREKKVDEIMEYIDKFSNIMENL